MASAASTSSNFVRQEGQRVALIVGVTGQDGSYLAEFLLSKSNYIVHGLLRRSSSFNRGRIDHIYFDPKNKNRFFLHYGDLLDSSAIISIISNTRPDEVYNLGAQSHVRVSFEMTEYTSNVNSLGTLRLLDALISCGLKDTVRFYQASTSELYGKVREIPQSETTPFYPRSPYAVSKQFAYWATVNYREAYNIHASNGILFNHESPRRGLSFVTRKITRSVAKIHKGMEKCISLGNLDAKRDWGHAREYVEAMWLMLQQEKADDYVIATGDTHSVREFVEKAFAHIGLNITWEGEAENEIGKTQNGDIVVRIDPRLYRPTEVDLLLGNPEKAHRVLGWKSKITFETLVQEMVTADIKIIEEGLEVMG